VETEGFSASDQSASDGFGMAVALRDDMIIVGAPGSPAGGLRLGKAYVFERIGQDWAETQILFAPDTINGDAFGASVAFSGDSAIIGAPLVDLAGTDSGQAYHSLSQLHFFRPGNLSGTYTDSFPHRRI